MKALRFLRDIRDDIPEDWEALNDAIEDLERLEEQTCDNCKYWVQEPQPHCHLILTSINLGGCRYFYEPKN